MDRAPRRIYPVKQMDKAGKVVKVIPVKELKKRCNPFKGKKHPARALPKPHVAFRKHLIENATFAERLFKSFLRRAGIPFKWQKIIHTGNRNYRYADFYLPALKWIIEIDGKYHETPEQVILDKKGTDEILEVKPGFEVVRYTNEQVSEHPEGIFEDIILRMRVKFEEALESTRAKRTDAI